MKGIKNLKIWLSLIICITLIMSAISLLANDKYMNVYAEDNDEETEVAEFETIEKQILNSDRCCSAENDELGISLDIENMWFLPNEDIVVSYIASNEQEITDFDYKATGFEVVDIEIDEENSSRITTELNCLPNEDEYILNIPITIGGEDTSVSLYAINNNYGTFVSQFSTANAYERYLEYAVTENIVTLEQAEEMWYAYLESDDENAVDEDDITMENIESGIAPASTGRGTVCGYLKWKERGDGDLHPLRGIKVEIYYKFLGVGIKLATTYTRDDGYYSVEIDAHDNVYIKIYAGDDNVIVGSGIFGWPYSIKFDAERYQCDVSSGETVMINTPDLSMTYDEESKIKEEVKHAFQIGQAAIAARDYADAMMDQNVTKVKIVYPSLPAIGTCYVPVLSCIAIDGISDAQKGLYSYETWDITMHEYGHHIEFLLNIMLDPLVLEHSTNVNLADEYNSVDRGTRMAWGESWNTVFGIMAQDYLIKNNRLDANIETVGDTHYSFRGGSFFDIEQPVRLGEACEQSIMGVLWDLYDSNNEGNDTITLSHEEYWELTTEAWTYRFSARANRFYELYANEPEMIKAFAEILTYYKMAPSRPTVHNASTVSITEAPELQWIPQGGSVDYPNNSFNIIIYDSSYNEILSIEDIEDTEYIFDDNIWQQALANHGYPCAEEFKVYITVAGSRKEPLSLDPNFSTGPYYSEYLELFVKTGHMITYEQNNDNNHIKKCNTCDGSQEILEHTFALTSNGSSDHNKTCIYCGYYKTYSHNMEYDYNNNIYHKGYCRDCGCSYFYRHTFQYTNNNDGTHTLTCTDCGYISTTEEHDYTNRYVSKSNTSHNAYCICGARAIEEHRLYELNGYNKCYDCNYSIEVNHVHVYMYTPISNGRSHTKSCRCGISTTEICMGYALIDGTSYCRNCGQEILDFPGLMSVDEEEALPFSKYDYEYQEQTE